MFHKYKIAGVVVSADFIYAYSPHICKPWEYSGDEQASVHLEISMQDIENQLQVAKELPPPYAESLVFFRKFNDYLLENHFGTVFHCSAVMVDGKAYLFTAPSGTGKSTHARLWRELLGDKVVMINDDKPIIRKTEKGFFVYGSPWQGKHELGDNICGEIQAICFIKRAKTPCVKQMAVGEFLPILFGQTVRAKNQLQSDNLISLLESLTQSVKLYQIECNEDIESAKVAYQSIVKEQ